MQRPVLAPGPDHPITVEPTPSRVEVSCDGRVIASTSAALTMREADYPPVLYIPIGDVEPGVLERTATRTYCPYKGEAGYYTLAADAGEIPDAVWRYDEPYEAVRAIAGHVAFYPQHVEVTVGPQ